MTEARSTTEALGQSGASVRINHASFSVTKLGDRRVHEQGLWLQMHEAPGLVNVRQVYMKGLKDPEGTTWGYTMDLLSSIPFRTTHPRALADEIAFILKRDVWSKPAEVDIDWQAHHEYLMDRVRAYAPDLLEQFADQFVEVIHWSYDGKLPGCLVHGDPTFANVMLNGQQHVLIDPIPAAPHLPSLRALDLGKIVQSLLGYETRRFGWYFPMIMAPGEITSWVDHYTNSTEETQAVWYFTAFHYLRLLPYTPPEHYDAMMELLNDAVDRFV
jgi:hypothetical protein